MADESNGVSSAQPSHENGQPRSASDNIRDLTSASKQLLEAGKQMTDNLAELSERVEHASDIGAQVFRSPWLVVVGAIAAGTVLLVASRRR